MLMKLTPGEVKIPSNFGHYFYARPEVPSKLGMALHTTALQ